MPVPEGEAHVPSPRQKVEDEAEVPAFKNPTGMLVVAVITPVPFDVKAPVVVALRVSPLTEVGTIAPRAKDIAGVVVAVATVPETPPVVVTETEVTVPDPLPVPHGAPAD